MIETLPLSFEAWSHISFLKLKIMALKGDIPQWLANCRVLMCAACQYGKLASKPW
jgi:hypothetical protein